MDILDFLATEKFYEFLDSINKDTTGNILAEKYQKICGILDDTIFGDDNDQFISSLEENTILYRARVINPEDDKVAAKGLEKDENGSFKGYNDFYSREPILGIGGAGRNNISGVSYFYAASDPETACMEIKALNNELISLAEFKVLKRMKMIDFSKDVSFPRPQSELFGMNLARFYTLLMAHYSISVRNEKDYRLTQLVSDYIRKYGVDGIIYGSGLVPGGTNYTIFHSHPKNIQFIRSRVLIQKKGNQSFWDFESKKAIFSNPDQKGMKYNEEIAERHLKNMDSYFRKDKQ